jgi:hypothetical protein
MLGRLQRVLVVDQWCAYCRRGGGNQTSRPSRGAAAQRGSQQENAQHITVVSTSEHQSA